MKKILILIFCVFIASTALAQTVADDLAGLGMPAEQADYLASIIPAGAALDNNVYLKGDNQAGSATINIIKINTSDDTVINSSASDDLILQLEDDASRLITFDAASDTALVMKFGDSGTTAAQVFSVVGTTSDADDDSELDICAGGACGSSRGAGIRMMGNEDANEPADFIITTGAVSGGDAIINLAASNSTLSIRDASTTPIAAVSQLEGMGFDDDASAYSAVYVATPATNLTPVVAVSEMKPHTIIAAAGPTAQAIGIFGTPIAGERKCVENYSANPLIVAAMGTPVINGGTNRTTSVPTLRRLCCKVGSAASTYDCLLEGAFTIPTPIGG